MLKGYEGMKAREQTIPPRGKVRLADALERLIELYTAANKQDDVKKYQKLQASGSPELPKPPAD